MTEYCTFCNKQLHNNPWLNYATGEDLPSPCCNAKTTTDLLSLSTDKILFELEGDLFMVHLVFGDGHTIINAIFDEAYGDWRKDVFRLEDIHPTDQEVLQQTYNDVRTDQLKLAA